MPAKKTAKKRKPVIKVKNLYKSFKVGKGTVEVLKGLDFEIYSGEFVVIFGPSGCGKSTLLNTIVGLEVPTSGKVYIRNTDIYALESDKRAEFRQKKFGIVQQQSNWIKSLNVAENVALPLSIAGHSFRKSVNRARKLLHLFRLEEFEKNAPAELSGGQQQRVSVVRALVSNPWILVTDEPTGNLDTVSANDLMYVLQYLNSESKRTVIMVTHNPAYESYATKVIKMEDGRITSIKTKKAVNVREDEMVGDVVPEEASEVPV